MAASIFTIDAFNFPFTFRWRMLRNCRMSFRFSYFLWMCVCVCACFVLDLLSLIEFESQPQPEIKRPKKLNIEKTTHSYQRQCCIYFTMHIQTHSTQLKINIEKNGFYMNLSTLKSSIIYLFVLVSFDGLIIIHIYVTHYDDDSVALTTKRGYSLRTIFINNI